MRVLVVGDDLSMATLLHRGLAEKVPVVDAETTGENDSPSDTRALANR